MHPRQRQNQGGREAVPTLSRRALIYLRTPEKLASEVISASPRLRFQPVHAASPRSRAPFPLHGAASFLRPTRRRDCPSPAKPSLAGPGLRPHSARCIAQLWGVGGRLSRFGLLQNRIGTAPPLSSCCELCLRGPANEPGSPALRKRPPCPGNAGNA